MRSEDPVDALRPGSPLTGGSVRKDGLQAAPLTVAVFNDGCYNALRVRQEAAHERRYVGTQLGAVDFAQVARGLGLRGERIASVEQLRARFAEAAAPREPLLLDIPIDPAPLSERYAAVIEAGG